MESERREESKAMLGEKYLQTKCTVNQRMPLEDRITAIQGSSVRALKEAPPSSSSLLPRRQPIESSYNASIRSAVRDANDVPARVREPFSTQQADSTQQLPALTTTLTARDMPFYGSATTRSEYNCGNPQVPHEHLTFYSQVRKSEQSDLDALKEASRKQEPKSLRTVAIAKKREADPGFTPPSIEFSEFMKSSRAYAEKPKPVDAVPMDSVNCTLLMPTTTNRIDLRKPQDILPPSLPVDYHVQRSVMSECGSGYDMFQGTTKARTDVIPLFMGHTPSHARNVAQIKGEGVEILRPFSKCTVNLASSKGVGSHRVEERSDASIAQTVMGFYTLQAARASDEERGMNRRERKAKQ